MVSLTSRATADPALLGSIDRLVARFLEHHDGGDVELIRRAGVAAINAHEGQLRRTGEPYVTHPIAVAGITADLGLDEVTIAAALLHDAVEDTGVTTEWLSTEFGAQVAAVVDGVTKLDRLEFDSKEAQQAATIRKMFIAMAQDWRVLLIKLADRLHNMRTISVMPMHRQRAIAQETLDVYAPLAHRLGVQQVKWQLEDLSFATLHPKRYAEIEQMVAARQPEREAYLGEVMTTLRGKLSEFHIAADVRGRPKHLWSIYEKMVVGGKEFDEIFDLVGLRIIVDDERDCWAALGAIHALWSPVQGRFKDYINSPKFNLYQSLHTTVIGPRGKSVEVQVRTNEMHRRAEFGVAAHWSYKEGASAKEVAWMQRLADVEEEEADPIAFLEALKLDLGQDEVYIFTPKGRVIPLIEGATPIDFAYAVHTEVGHHCVGAKVNGRLVPLDTVLKSADVVEIVTSKSDTAGPSRDWLNLAKSSRAKSKIRQWFQRERRDDAIEGGREELTKALRREGLPIATSLSSSALDAVIRSLNLEDLDALFMSIDSGQISALAVVQRLDRELRGGDAEQLPTTVTKAPRSGRTTRRSAGVYVEGLDDVMIHLARCCSPVPGDSIMGFITQGRGVSVHRDDCSNAVALAQRLGERIIDVEWDGSAGGQYRAVLEILAFDRSRLLLDVSRVVAEYHLNIIASSSTTSGTRIVRMIFDVELADPAHLSSLLAALKSVDGVFDAFRQLPGQNKGS
ncbi:MAG: bifunctional (p)ppGpp synthetase/guanosine-3',5'-bis(diphosphate) 3'-pyrophosphohydrolase [Acidobacteriota bacterium]|nr:bifunctional (p)ppGpp synthetase/guanosine-3',5'-bis(diphosphate) 3'-pyrophosphohydrolase [Acidobacteriota bacterium]MDE3043374.1 bifunctional (p)ppGpp synthetase/guanosine-3',5'-bis(diphosphate) 3'-pyrophosphohydrolase [Acidobacteriota bacterium]MDE3106679.1 bifunctional (p)ppGpp synthetase/guanosine-3',5'-bis(diphosphate) 3'-pyrophosphohydrolase [Acidobacteriota bacterium]MDE3223608.1 bifunctional (p)ppGpp synthetase/guanosine-3',5'-bis(diphosphate) 3'-pyrophosphohydrolase [Acidobacteriota 